jgi:hypothetical protein
VASEMSPHPLTIKAQTKHHGPLIKVVIESEIWGRYNNGRMSSSHGRRAPCLLSIFLGNDKELGQMEARVWAAMALR